MNYTKNKTIKIAMIGQKGVPAIFGGVERSVDELGSRLAEAGYKVTVYSRPWYTKIQKTNYKGMTIKKIPTINTKHLDAIVHTFLSTIHALFQKYNIIHYHGVGPSLMSWIPRIFNPRTKIITSFQSIDREHAKWGWFARLALRMGEYTAVSFSHAVLASSFMIVQYIKEKFGTKAVYLPNGATIPTQTSDEFDATLIKQFDLEPNKYFVVVTRLVQHKGVHEVIAGFKRAKKANPEAFQNMKLAIVGAGSFTNTYFKMLKTMSLTDKNIVFTGYQAGQTLQALMRQAYLGIHASHAEGLPMSVLEIMAQKTAVLVSAIQPHMEVVHDEHLLFPVGDLSELEKAIVRLALDKNFVSKKSKQAQEFVANQYSWDRVATKLMLVYEEELALQSPNLEHKYLALTSR